MALVATTLLLPQMAEAANGLVATSHSVRGHVVMVEVQNTTSSPKSGTVQVSVTLQNGLKVVGIRGVSLQAGQTGKVPVPFLSLVSGVDQLKINHEMDPF